LALLYEQLGGELRHCRAVLAIDGFGARWYFIALPEREAVRQKPYRGRRAGAKYNLFVSIIVKASTFSYNLINIGHLVLDKALYSSDKCGVGLNQVFSFAAN
jgi:hypothetical protein